MRKEEKGEELEEEEECLEMKVGENNRDLKCLQVDLSTINVLRGSIERIRSRTSSGKLDHIPASISGELIRDLAMVGMVFDSYGKEGALRNMRPGHLV